MTDLGFPCVWTGDWKIHSVYHFWGPTHHTRKYSWNGYMVYSTT